MEKRMYTVKLPESEATLAGAAKRLGVEPAELDPDFGVVLVSPTDHVYTVLLSEGATPVADGQSTAGPYSNPAIGAFGPPKR
jgi:hypothetical protein